MIFKVKSNNNYRVHIKKQSLSFVASLYPFNNQVVIISDTNIPNEYIVTVAEQYNTNLIYLLKPGEKSKSIKSILNIINFLLDNNITRSDLLIGIGGGVIIDIVGFVSSIYKRGVKYLTIPTSTIAQIDSCLGGKTGINYRSKNIIGSFNNPEMVIVDTNLLKSLDERNYLNGVIEASKIAVCFDKDLFFLIEKNFKSNINKIITKSLTLKKMVIEKDEKDENYRQILNFGHTIGHIIEINYPQLLHGECVAIGMILECKDKTIKNELLRLYKKIGLYPRIKKYLAKNYEQFFMQLLNDKKWTNDHILMVEILEIGKGQLKLVQKEEIKNILRGEVNGEHL